MGAMRTPFLELPDGVAGDTGRASADAPHPGQKLKMDVEMEMLGVEQLLRNNTLNMEMMAMVPAVAGLYLIYSATMWLLNRLSSRGQVASLQNIFEIIVEIERLLNRASHTTAHSLPTRPWREWRALLGGKSGARDHGRYRPRPCAHVDIPAGGAGADDRPVVTRSMFIQDVRELANFEFTTKQKMNTLQRMQMPPFITVGTVGPRASCSSWSEPGPCAPLKSGAVPLRSPPPPTVAWPPALCTLSWKSLVRLSMFGELDLSPGGSAAERRGALAASAWVAACGEPASSVRSLRLEFRPLGSGLGLGLGLGSRAWNSGPARSASP